ncbi:MAG: hypothetical protein PHQ40_00595 [Anaerolineaceae bacterium]|nr:hypothetical protein [Anaerolineaceae bacterium]
MVLRLFPLVAYLAAAAYLVCWLISQLQAIYQRVRAWRLQRRMVFSLKAWSKVGKGHDFLIYLAGALLGGLVTFWLVQVFIQEWLLVIFAVLALLSDELRVSPKETQLLEVMIFFDRMAAHIVDNQDLFEVLTKVIQELPEGNVQKGVREAVLHHRSGTSFESSLKVMRGIDSFLDEFVLTLQLSGWRNGPGSSLILNRLLIRAGRRWDRNSRLLLIKDKNRTCFRFGRASLVTGLWVILISNSSALALVMAGRTVIVWSGLALLCSGLVFYLIVSTQWLRYFLAVSIFILAFVSYANSLVVPIPSWIQVETISHRSDRVGDTGMVIPQVSTVHQELTASFQRLSVLNNQPGVESTTPTSIPTLIAVPTMILKSPVMISTRIIPEELDPCCLRSHQPR